MSKNRDNSAEMHRLIMGNMEQVQKLGGKNPMTEAMKGLKYIAKNKLKHMDNCSGQQ